ncbi:hypothetical protein [Methanobacterium spitsbergense]|uniref:Uncharacterized protein n=1 Tax=Methanobacterium spitsbergense TaxID=2874285 RepID=A0A8T5US13_9EURY|nr:hypothetical protein [Methanobacterium spitsbergense]MBZ2166842.1 hypothetical protein [Methanobacterium spitsbergense]
MNQKIKSLFLILTLFGLFVSIHGTYAVYPIEVKVDSGGYYTATSWFKPHIVRNIAGGTFAWTVCGTVWFSKASGKWPGYYWESGGYTPAIWDLPLRTYASPYIAHAQIHMTAAQLNYNNTTLYNNTINAESKMEYSQDIIIENNTIIKNEFTQY